MVHLCVDADDKTESEENNHQDELAADTKMQPRVRSQTGRYDKIRKCRRVFFGKEATQKDISAHGDNFLIKEIPSGIRLDSVTTTCAIPQTSNKLSTVFPVCIFKYEARQNREAEEKNLAV